MSALAPPVPATALDWEAIARRAMHPIAVSVLEMLARVSDQSDPARSPVDFAAVLDAPLGVVSYHVRMLAGRGLIELARTEPRRGALQHFYVLTGEAAA